MGEHCGAAHTDAVYIAHRQRIRNHLCDEVAEDERGDEHIGNIEFVLENNEEERRKIIDDALRDVTAIAGKDRLFEIRRTFLWHKIPSLINVNAKAYYKRKCVGLLQQF